MGFNFGAMLGGAATQIVDDINEKEKDVKLRTRTILDRKVAQTAANRKEFKAQEKKVTEQMNALVGIFGNTPDGIAKARDVVAGGDIHYTNMYSQIQEHAKNGGDANELVSLTKGANDIGFKGVEDAVGSIVKLAALPEIKTGSGFGSSYFNKEQQDYIDQGLIQVKQVQETAKVSYGSTKIHLEKIAKKAKSVNDTLDETFANLQTAKNGGKPDEIAKAQAARDAAIKRQESESITLKSAKAAADAKNTGQSTYREISSNFAADIKRFENDLYVGGDKGKIRADNEDGFLGIRDGGDKIKQQKLEQYGVDWLKGQIDGNGKFINAEAEQFVKDNGTLRSLLPGVISSVTGEKDTSGGSTSGNKITRKEKIATFVKENPDVTPDVAKQFIDLAKKGTINSAKSLSDKLMLKYPKPEGESASEYQKRIDDIAIGVWSEYSKTQADQIALEKKNNLIREQRFTPKNKTSADGGKGGIPDKKTYIDNYGPTEGAAKYKEEMIKQLKPNFGSNAERIFNQMVKDGKA